MKIIIDIPEEVYECCLPFKGSIVISNECNYLSEMTYSIANGTPLPKGHGRLIDADVIDDNIYELTRSLDLDYSQIINVVDDVPTIIEADIESKEE